MRRWAWMTASFWASTSWAAPECLPASLAGRWLGGLALVLLLMGACLVLLKRLGRLNAQACGQIRVVGGLSLGGRERLLVVEVGKTQLVLGVAPGRVQTLHVLAGEMRLTPDAGFSQQLRRIWGEKEKL